jgi:UTP--glucose-1-phosphate uridylyltransferase
MAQTLCASTFFSAPLREPNRAPVDARANPCDSRRMTSRKPIRKAVFPVAGLGTRFLPATKAIPKEMLPVIDRPLIQYAVDEAREAGIEQMIFITGRGKTAIVEHFDMAYELETTMRERDKDLSALEPTRLQPGNLVTVRQQVPLGLGHAIWCARAIVGDEPFAILLPDELMVANADGGPGCMKQMVEAYNEVGGNLISVLEVPEEEVSSYGVIAPGAQSGALTEVKGLVEKPKREDAPSNLIVSGRYILQPEVMRVLEGQGKGAGGEIQLTDAMAQMIGSQPFHAVTFAGQRFDCGSKAGMVEATLTLALQREDLRDEVRAMARRLLGAG